MSAISRLYAGLPDPGLPARQANEYVQFAQDEAFFHLAVAKDARLAQLRAHFAETGVRKVFLSANLAGFGCSVPGADVEILAKDFFSKQDPARFQAKKSQLESCVVIVNNNDVGTGESRAEYAALFGECTASCFVAWDWDNHHWLELSPFLAAHSDIYAPAHHENLFLLSRYNWLIAGPVYCSTVQWSRAFLAEHLQEILLAERSDAPLGMHIPYAQFKFRIQVITTLNKRYSSVGFTTRAFHERTPEDRLVEWCAHKTHWIAPVLNDVPIRIFDALLTGGIPITPISLRFLPPVHAIPRDYIVFYSPVDIVHPDAVVDQANKLFDAGGEAGIMARQRYALQYHHGDVSVQQMLGCAAEALGISWAPH